MAKFKPMKAVDWYPERVSFPCIVQPKVDGVHYLNREGKALGRTLKEVANKYTAERWSGSVLHGVCGEMCHGDTTAEDLCRNTTSAMNKHEGEPSLQLVIFDYVPDEETAKLPYFERLAKIPSEVARDYDTIIVDSKLCQSMEELEEFEAECLAAGYEGVIIRDPNLPYKYGSCGKTYMGVWRVKRMIEEEILVKEILEGHHNANEAKKNELGRTERSTHKANMIPNGMVGGLVGPLIKDVYDPVTGRLLFEKGMEITVSPGKMTEKERKYYFENPDEIVGQYVKFKMFPRGVKDKPRFPVYTMIRPKDDMIV